jgi:hypothetical protein
MHGFKLHPANVAVDNIDYTITPIVGVMGSFNS